MLFEQSDNSGLFSNIQDLTSPREWTQFPIPGMVSFPWKSSISLTRQMLVAPAMDVSFIAYIYATVVHRFSNW